VLPLGALYILISLITILFDNPPISINYHENISIKKERLPNLESLSSLLAEIIAA